MTSEWFESRPIEDWDFSELHDCLREALSERDEAESEQSVLLSTAARFQRERDALRAAFLRYARHIGDDCVTISGKCGCGLSQTWAVLAAKEEPISE